jgi:hypothetical protein
VILRFRSPTCAHATTHPEENKHVHKQVTYFLSKRNKRWTIKIKSHIYIYNDFFYHFSLLSKNESRLIKSPVCLLSVYLSVRLSVHPSVCVFPTNNFWTAWYFFVNISYGGNASQGDLNTIIFNHIPSTILKLLRFIVVRWALLNCAFVFFMFHDNHCNQVVYCSKFG